jgi:hypothetical protein
MSDDVFDEMDRFNDEFRPQPSWRPGLDLLPDGLADFEIVAACGDRTPKSNDPIVRWTLKVLSGPCAGTLIDHVHFVGTLESVERLGGDLQTLGFDVENWKPPQRPVSVELKKALPMLRGRCFRAKKETNPGQQGKVFHNLRVYQLLTKDTPRLPVGAAPAAAAAPAPQAAAATADAPGRGRGEQRQRRDTATTREEDDSEIPF